MKTTIDISRSTLERAKALANAQGISLDQLLARTLEEKLGHPTASSSGGQPAWMSGFGSLADLREESARVMRLIEDEFEEVEPEDR